jgi:hypothetical protein
LTRPLHWAAFCAALTAVSCAGPQPAPDAEQTPAKPASEAMAKLVPAPPEAQTPTENMARLIPKPKPEPRIKRADLIGLTEAEITKILGAPSFKRIDDPAALWQYRGTGCILDLFLYADGPSYRVTHLEVRGRQEGQTAGIPLQDQDAARCFAKLLPAGKNEG